MSGHPRSHQVPCIDGGQAKSRSIMAWRRAVLKSKAGSWGGKGLEEIWSSKKIYGRGIGWGWSYRLAALAKCAFEPLANCGAQGGSISQILNDNIATGAKNKTTGDC